MKTIIYIPCVILIVLSSGCGALSHNGIEDSPHLQEEAVHELLGVALSLEELSTATVREILGPPQDVHTEAIPNRHRPDQTDTLRTMRYEGLEIQLYETHPAPDLEEIPRILPVYLQLTDSSITAPNGVRVGDTRERVREVLGDPEEAQQDTWSYAVGAPDPQLLEIAWANDRVEKLTWHFYVD